MALITQADLEARLGRALTATEATSFTLINEANQAYVEDWIGSSVEEAEPSTRYFDGGSQHTPINPATDISAVGYYDDDGVANDPLDTTDYTTEPRNNTVKTMIRWRPGKFFRGMNNIGVTAKFSIYGDVKLRNMVKAALMESLISEMTNNDNVKRESIEGYSVEYATTETKSALDSIKYLFPRII